MGTAHLIIKFGSLWAQILGILWESVWCKDVTWNVVNIGARMNLIK